MREGSDAMFGGTWVGKAAVGEEVRGAQTVQWYRFTRLRRSHKPVRRRNGVAGRRSDPCDVRATEMGRDGARGGVRVWKEEVSGAVQNSFGGGANCERGNWPKRVP